MAVISAPAPVKIIVHHDQPSRAEIMISSPMRLGSGGRARLAKQVINHHVAIKGRIICEPRVRIIVRLWVRS